MGSLYNLTLGSMFETPSIKAARKNRRNENREIELFERELQLREREIELKENEIKLELMKINNDKNIINGLIYY